MKDTYEQSPITTGFDRSLSEALARKHGIELPRERQVRYGETFNRFLQEDTASLLLRFGHVAQFACAMFLGIIPNLLFMKVVLGWF